MYVTQILLPAVAGNGRRVSRREFAEIKKTLTARFGGVTAHMLAPAEGRWKAGKKTHRDHVFILEVVSRRQDVRWWKRYRALLESRFQQEKILVRSTECRII